MSTILVVDDQPHERRLLYHALKRDHTVLEAEDGLSALARVKEDAIDLVILDMHLPPATATPEEGMRLQQAIRLWNPLLPVIVATADGDDALAREMGRRGVAGYLTKPIDPVRLKKVIARALRRDH